MEGWGDGVMGRKGSEQDWKKAASKIGKRQRARCSHSWRNVGVGASRSLDFEVP